MDSNIEEFVIRLDKYTNKTVEMGIANPQLKAAELQIRLNRGSRQSAELTAPCEQNPRQISCNNPKESSAGFKPSNSLLGFR